MSERAVSRAATDRARPPRRSWLAGLALALAVAARTAAPLLVRAVVNAVCDFFEFSGTSSDKPAIDGELHHFEKKPKNTLFLSCNPSMPLARSLNALAK